MARKSGRLPHQSSQCGIRERENALANFPGFQHLARAKILASGRGHNEPAALESIEGYHGEEKQPQATWSIRSNLIHTTQPRRDSPSMKLIVPTRFQKRAKKRAGRPSVIASGNRRRGAFKSTFFYRRGRQEQLAINHLLPVNRSNDGARIAQDLLQSRIAIARQLVRTGYIHS